MIYPIHIYPYIFPSKKKYQKKKPRNKKPRKNSPKKNPSEKNTPGKKTREKLYPNINLPGKKKEKLVLGYFDALHGET